MTKTFFSVAFVATMALAAAPAQAQHRGGGGHSGGAARGAAVYRSGASRGAVVSTGHAQARSTTVYRGAAVYRGGAVYHGGGVYRGGVVVAHPYYYRPYYAFRPSVSIGFGFWAGYPVAYSSYYAYPYPYSGYGYAYPYAAPYAYGYPAQPYAYPAQPDPQAGQSSVYPSGPYPPSQQYPNAPGYSGGQVAPPAGAQQGYQSATSGGVSFQITPDTAEVYVDGSLVGAAGSFGPRNEPLGLPAGRHHVEIRAPGYRTMNFDADIQPGQVIPYQGELQRN